MHALTARPLRVLVHDFAGHPFQVELSRELARRGFKVLHLYFSDGQTPKGDLVPRCDDPPGFQAEGIDIGESFRKHSYVARLRQERLYGRLLSTRIREYGPDVVMSANSAIDSQSMALQATHALGAGFVSWVQDIYSVAVDRLLRRKLLVVGAAIGWRFRRLEGRILRGSDAVVLISDDFRGCLTDWKVSPASVSVIENWAPLDAISPGPKDNPWSREHGLADKRVLLYSGTLGLKHDPSLILSLAQSFSSASDVRVVVVSEGLGADWLREHGRRLPTLVVLPFQAFKDLPNVIASADVVLAILEPDAGVFSVPSKVLTYMAAGKAIVAAMPIANLAARTVVLARAGLVVPPGDHAAFVRSAHSLLDDLDSRATAGRAGRAYAVQHFAIGPIADRFESILRRAASRSGIAQPTTPDVDSADPVRTIEGA